MASGDTLAIFGPAGYEPPVTNPAGFGTRDTTSPHPALTFDTTAQEIAVWSGVMPQNYAGGKLKVIITWAAATATSGTIGWDVTFERDTEQDTDEEGWATAQTITAATVNATAGKPSQTSVEITAGSTGTDSVVKGDLYRLRVRRDVANDTATGDAHLLMVEIREA